MEHVLLDVDTASYDGTQFTGRVYRGVFIRHSRDGHIVLPFGDPPAKLWLPFDVGALAEVGALSWRPDATATIGVVKTAALVDLARSKDHRLRLRSARSRRGTSSFRAHAEASRSSTT